MTQEKTLNEQAREVAQKLVDLEITRKDVTSEMTELKEKFEELVEEGADSSIDVNNGQVFILNTIVYSVPDGLKEEVVSRVKDVSKLNPELIEQYFNTDLKLSRKATKALRDSSDPDLAQLVVQEEKSKVVIKV